MKGITLCADCAYYSMKKHKCTRGATDDGEPTASFYADCPLDDVMPVVRCKSCQYAKPYERADGQTGYYCQQPNSTFMYGTNWERLFEPVREADDFCSYGERREGE